MAEGKFITFEGADGSGKTTQLKIIKEFLENSGYKVVETREPGATAIGEKIREILLHETEKISDNCEMFLFLADRAEHIERLIKPAIECGKIVLCDRHTDSTIAYQGYGRGKNKEILRKLNDIAVNGLIPDLTLLFDVTIETAQNRVGKDKDRMESAGREFFERVRNGYLELQKENPERIKLINANNSIETVTKDTKDIIIKMLEKDRRINVSGV